MAVRAAPSMSIRILLGIATFLLLLILRRLCVGLEESANGQIVDDLFGLLHIVLQSVKLLSQSVVLQVQKTQTGLKG